MEYSSTPVLLNSELSNQYSLTSRPPTDHSLPDNNPQTKYIVAEKSKSDEQSIDNDHVITRKARIFTLSQHKPQRIIHSWHGLTNIQLPSVHKNTNLQNGPTSQISTIIKSLIFQGSTKNLTRVPTDEPDKSTNSLPQNSQSPIILSKNHVERNSKLDWNESLLINEIDGDASIQVEQEDIFFENAPSKYEPREIPSNQVKSQPQRRHFYYLSFAINLLLIGPLVVVFWNNTWVACDLLIFSDSCILSAWTSVAIGFPLTIAISLLQDTLLRSSKNCNKPVRYLAMRLYTYVGTVSCINQWRGAWMIFGCYTGNSSLHAAVSFASAALLLILLRSLRTVSAPPVFASLEVPHSAHYKVATFWMSKPSLSLRFILDNFISVFVVQVFSITYWRGLWEWMDFCFFPDDPQMSAICCLIIAVTLGAILLASQTPLTKISARLHAFHWIPSLAFQDLVTVLYSIVCITYWRGIWMFLNLYQPNRPESLYIAHGISFIILVVGLTSNSALVRGVLRDGIDLGDHGIVFDLSYVATLQEAWRNKKETKNSCNGEPMLIPQPTGDEGQHPIKVDRNVKLELVS